MMAGCLLCRVHRLKVVVAMTEDHLEATLVLHLRGVEEDTSNLAEVQVVVEVAMEMVEAAMEGGAAAVVVAMEEGMGDMAVVVVEEAVMEAVREVEDLVEEAVVAGVDMEVTAEVEVGASLVEEEEEEALVLVVAEEVMEVVAAVEDLVGMTGLKRCRATTRSLSRECQLMSQKMMSPSSLVPSAQSRRTEKLANSAFSSTQIAILAPPREKAPSLMKIQAPHSLLFNGSMARNSAPAAPSKLAWP